MERALRERELRQDRCIVGEKSGGDLWRVRRYRMYRAVCRRLMLMEAEN